MPSLIRKNIRRWQKDNERHIWIFGLGTGLALYGIHWREQPLLNYFFLPQLGLIIIIACLLLYYTKYSHRPDFGPKYVWVPMLVIVASIVARLVVDFSFISAAGALYGVILFGVYLLSRQLGKEIFMVFIPFVAIVAVSCIVNGIMHPGETTGGIITNYCASAGFMIFGTAVNKFKWQWVLATLVLVALFFVGALEALFAVIVLGIVILARKDWGRKLLLPIGLVAVVLLSSVMMGNFGALWGKTNLAVAKDLITGETPVSDATLDMATTGRWVAYDRAVSNIEPLGHGFWVTMPPECVEGYSIEYEPVHNVPLVIVDQIGPTAGLAWLFITIFCLVKTKWKYAWSAVLVLSVFDHYIFTQFAPYWWCLAGVSTASTLKSDYIFRKI